MKKLFVLAMCGLFLFSTTSWGAVVGSNLKVPTESTVHLDTGTNTTITTGHQSVVQDWAGADIQSGVTTSLASHLSITGGPLIVYMASGLQVRLNAETVSDALQIQVLIDGTVVADFEVVEDGSDNVAYWRPANAMVECNSSFEIKAKRTGTFDSGNSRFDYTIYYDYL